MQAPNEMVPKDALQLFQRGNSLLDALPPRTEDALECFEDAAKSCRRAGAEYSYATALSNIGFLYASMGKNREAVDYYRRALEIFDSKWPTSREAANTLHNLGNAALKSPGMHMLALRYFERAISIDSAFSPESSDCGRDLDGIATAYEFDGDLTKAIEYFEKAMAIQQRALPHYAFMRYLRHLADLCEQMGDECKAMAYRARVSQGQVIS